MSNREEILVPLDGDSADFPVEHNKPGFWRELAGGLTVEDQLGVSRHQDRVVCGDKATQRTFEGFERG